MRVIGSFIAVVCFGAGCDGVFGLDTVHSTVGADARDCVRIGHDEDGDSLDDGCDPCPFDTHNDVDDDNDGIALACDPDPTAANARLMFTGFGGVGPNIELRDAAIVDDAVVTTIPLTKNSYVLWPDVGSDDVWLVMGVDVGATLSTATYRQLGFIFDATDVGSNDLDGTLCVLATRASGTPMDHVQVYSRLTGGADVSLEDNPSPFPLAQWHGVIRASYSRGLNPQVSCDFKTTGGATATVSATRTPPPPAGRLGIFIDDCETSIRFLFVVGKS